uniref:Uncharacterized protein n=1 Tax=Arundo donax TaxID=35708 RepID=A0A0A9FB12_ARUDO
MSPPSCHLPFLSILSLSDTGLVSLIFLSQLLFGCGEGCAPDPSPYIP